MAMRRQAAIEALADGRNGAISVAIMQAMWPWHEAGQGEQDHLDVIGFMGGASPIALGLALAQPDRKVMVLDGDGSLLLQLSTLVTIASLGPRNLYHFVFDNGRYETSGNQPVPGYGKFDFCQLAQAAGYADALTVETSEALRAALPRIWSTPGPVLIRLVIEREDGQNPWPKVRMAQQVRQLEKRLAAGE
jgi:thiamine pyrophosphate-dependent acetolactate synthase large subunit-like protein